MEGIEVMRAASAAQPTTPLFNNDVQPDNDAQPRRSIAQALPLLTDSMAEGQIVIICARWLLVLAALLLTLWSPGPDALADIRLRVPVLLLLAVANFYLHAQVLMRRPVAANIIYAASVADIIVITLLLLAQGGFASPLYIFYFPAILAFSVAFPTTITASFTAITIGIYSSISLLTVFDTSNGLPVLTMRLLILAAVAVCGQLYSQVEERRRFATADAFGTLLAQTRHADEPRV